MLYIQGTNLKVEVIVSDNSISNKTEDMCKSFEGNFSKFKYYRNKGNIGFARNVRKCLKRSIGKYIWLLGDDDVLYENSLKIIYDEASESISGWVCFNFTKILSNDNLKKGFNIDRFSTSSLNLFISNLGIWSSFMSCSIVHRTALEYTEIIDLNDYYAFSIGLMVGNKLGCSYVNKKVIIRNCSEIEKHRFNNIETYTKDFFKTINLLIEKKILIDRTKRKLANCFFSGIIPYIYIKSRIDNKNVSSLKFMINEFKYCFNFWIFLFPLYFTPNLILKILHINFKTFVRIKRALLRTKE
jgi:glycosyltransferase involved in cell wall biosynthesis